MTPRPTAHLIDGHWCDGPPGDPLLVVNPASDEVVGSISPASTDLVGEAVSAARRAADGWARTDPAERSALVRESAQRLRTIRRSVAELQSAEGGKPAASSLGGVDAGIGAIEQYAELGPLHRGRSLQGGWNAMDLMVPVPRGVAAVLVPWNDPVAVAGGQLAANLVAGNTVVFKPSERTPLCSTEVVTCFDHLPPGVINLVHGGPETGAALVAADVDLVLHTGSVATGREIAARCGSRLLPTVLELGGKDAMIIDEDVDAGWAASEASVGCFANAGQLCTSVERIYAHTAVHDDFVAALVAEAERFAPSGGGDRTAELGPLIDRRQRDLVHRHVTEAVEAGAKLLTGGEVPPGPGSAYPATVLVDVPDDVDLLREETFGPVAAVRRVDSFADGLERAAASRYGLAAVVLTCSQQHAQDAWRRLPVGTVKINAAFGGAPGGAAEPHGQSGWGFGYGPELLDELTRVRVVHLSPGRGRVERSGDDRSAPALDR